MSIQLSTNIFRVWIPQQGEVISTRDVIFNKETFDKKALSTDEELITHMDELLARLSLYPSQVEDDEIEPREHL